MPTIHREAGFRVYFFSHVPNEPPHVHMDLGAGSAKIWIETASVAINNGLSARDLRLAVDLVRRNRDGFLERWYEFFGS